MSDGKGAQLPVVVLGGLANALSVARSLGRRGVPVFCFGDRWSSVRLSRYCTRFVEVDPGDFNRYLEPLQQSGPGRGVLIPCGDDGLELVAHHRSLLQEMGYAPIEANDESLLAMLDKEDTYEIARAHGIPAPRTVVIESWEDLDSAIAAIGLPAAIKPRVSHDFAEHFTGKAVVVTDRSDAEKAYRAITAKDIDVLLTEIVPGEETAYESYYAYFDAAGTPLFEFTKRKLRQHPVGFGLGTLHRMTINPEVAAAGRKFAEAAKLRGLVCVEFKRSAHDGSYVLIECNHRITTANELIVASGIDLAGFVYDRLTGCDPPPVPPPRTDVAMWWPLRDTSSAIELMRAGRLSMSEWFRQLRGRKVFPVFQITDPLPVLAALARSGSRLWRYLRRRYGKLGTGGFNVDHPTET